MPAEPLTIAALARALQAGETTAETVVERCLAQIARRNDTVNAFITVRADQAREEARAADRAIAAGRSPGPLHGVPMSIKDLFEVRGIRTTAGSKIRSDAPAPDDAAAVARLRAAGAIIIGTTNLHEFALGTTNEDSAFGPVHHPLDPGRSPGGSSGGSAASVLADMAVASLGTDTGGSIRIPAAFCGLVGLKPGYGAVPTDGCLPLSPTLDHVGPICRSVGDARLVFDVLRGAGSHPAAVPRPAAGIRIGVLRGYFMAVIDPEVASAFEAACARLRDAGVSLEEVTVGHAADIPSIYLHIALSEAAAYHARTLDSRGSDYTPNVRLRLELGRYILAEDYVRALRGREVLRQEVDGALRGRDALLLPSVPVAATRLGSATVRVGGNDEPVRNITLRLTQLFNVTGHPAITLPCGETSDALPIGCQLVGAAGETPALLDTAESLEPYFGPGVSR